MTIATENGSIIVKGGKASCECCGEGPVCGCVSQTSVPQNLYVRFSGFSFAYHFSQPRDPFPFRPPEAETAAAEWLNTILAEVPLTRIVTTPVQWAQVSYGTGGCARMSNIFGKIPCPNCNPPFTSIIFISFPCSGGVSLPIYAETDQRPRWTIGPAFGCEPPGINPFFTTDITLRFSHSQVQQSWCSLAQGLTQSFTLDVEESRLLLSGNFVFYYYTGSGGTVTVSTNPLP